MIRSSDLEVVLHIYHNTLNYSPGVNSTRDYYRGELLEW